MPDLKVPVQMTVTIHFSEGDFAAGMRTMPRDFTRGSFATGMKGA